MIKNRKGGLIKFFVLIIILFGFFFLGNFIKRFYFSVVNIPESALFQSGQNLKSYCWGIFNIKRLVRKNKELERENLQLIQKIEKLKELEQENYQLKKNLKILGSSNFNLGMIKPIAFDLANNYLYVAIPREFKLYKNMPVITSEKAVLGVIDRIEAGYARIKLISNPDFSFIARTKDGLEVIVKGASNFQISLLDFPKDKEIKKGDKIFTSSNSKIFPSNLLVGEVIKVEKSDINPFQKVLIRPYFINFRNGEALFVLLNWRYIE